MCVPGHRAARHQALEGARLCPVGLRLVCVCVCICLFACLGEWDRKIPAGCLLQHQACLPGLGHLKRILER